MISVLTENDTDAFIEIRLKGLKESPMAFGASFEEGIDRELTAKNFRNRSNEYFTLGYFDQKMLVGIVGFIREQKLKKKHKSFVWGMYVDPEFRGKGIAKKLLQEVIKRAEKIDGLSKIILSVTSPQAYALGFYEHLGFERYALEKDAIRIDGKSIDEIFLTKQL